MQYRAYLLSPAGRIMAPVEIEACSLRDAIEQVAATRHPHGAEIWRGARLLARMVASAGHEPSSAGGG